MQRQALFIFLALTVLLAACARSTPTNFYLLESRLTPVSTDSLPAKSLRVAPVSVPEYLDREGIVSRVGESRPSRPWAEAVTTRNWSAARLMLSRAERSVARVAGS